MLKKLITICDDPEIFLCLQIKAKNKKNGCKGIKYGNKPHVLDAMKILKKIWLLDDKYSSKDMIRRCWRKANCLPTLDQINLNNDIGHRDRSEKQIESFELDELCNAMNHLRTNCLNMNKVPNFAVDTILETKEEISESEFRDGIEYWSNIEDDNLVINVEIEEALENLQNNRSNLSDKANISVDIDNQEEDGMDILSDKEIDLFFKKMQKWSKFQAENIQRSLENLIKDINSSRLVSPKIQDSILSYFKPIDNRSLGNFEKDEENEKNDNNLHSKVLDIIEID